MRVIELHLKPREVHVVPHHHDHRLTRFQVMITLPARLERTSFKASGLAASTRGTRSVDPLGGTCLTWRS